jgi:hypothetical protein
LKFKSRWFYLRDFFMAGNFTPYHRRDAMHRVSTAFNLTASY